MTRAEIERLLAAATTAGRITEAQAATVLASFDAGTLPLDSPAAVEAVIAGLSKKRRPGGGGYVYDPATRRYTTPSEPAPRPEPERPSKPKRLAKPKPLAGRIIARAKQYAQAARGTYEAVRGRVAELAGYDEEMRVLHGSDHCSTSGTIPGCPSLSGRWVPIGTLPRIGRAVCRSNCRCTFRFRRR